MSLKVAVCGASGRMGRETVRAIAAAPDLVLGPLADLADGSLPEGPVFAGLPRALEEDRADVCVDFTHPDAAVANAQYGLSHGVAMVIGTSGVGPAELEALAAAAAASGRPVLVVPNFAIGAVLMMRFAEEAARWMPEASLIEMHHPGKVDAPSGTAMHTAERIAKGRGSGFIPEARNRIIKAEGAMGASVHGVPVQSVRLPGLVAHQVVIFGASGETLTLRHDSLDRSSFMPGVLLAVRKVLDLAGLNVGLESLMFGSP